jgi:hypothetical protein
MVTKIPLTQLLQEVIIVSKGVCRLEADTYYREFVKVDGQYKKFSGRVARLSRERRCQEDKI